MNFSLNFSKSPRNLTALSSCPNERRRDESGAVIILVAMLLTALMIFGVIAIDISQYASSREQAQYYSRLAVLAALERFYAEGDKKTTPEKIKDALARAKEVSNINLMISDYGHDRGANFTNIENDSGSVDQSQKAVLTPGFWYYENPGEPADPCSGKYPCFRKADSIGDKTQITAFRVTGALYQGVTTRLARAVMGVESMPVVVFATAAVTPRHGCFVVDLTGSITAETHKVQSIANQDKDPLQYGRGVTASYVLNGDNPGKGENPVVDTYWTHLSSTVPNRPADAGAWNVFLASTYPTAMPAKTAASMTEAEYQSIHFASDYKKKIMLGNGDWALLSDKEKELYPNPSSNPNYEVYNGSPDRRWAYVDTFVDDIAGTDGTPKYSGPEPLHTVMTGLNAAMKEFQRRNVAGDRACLIFYNKRTPWPGLVKLTDNFKELIKLTDTSNAAAIVDDKPDTKPQTAAEGLELLIRHGLVPGGQDANFTNTPLALTEAANQLKEGNKNGGYSSDFIVSISDGVSNCYDTDSGGAGKYDCQNDFNHNVKSYENIFKIAKNAYQGKGIPIHWIMVGNSVAPHTLKYKEESGAGDGKCISDEDARKKGVSLVRGGWQDADPKDPTSFDTTKLPWVQIGTGGTSGSVAFQSMSPSQVYYQPNLVAYDLAVKTRGLWGPVRPRASTCGAGKKDDADLCSYNIDDKSALTDPNAVQKYDPYCRTPEEQMTDYMDRIIGDNPFSLVEGQ